MKSTVNQLSDQQSMEKFIKGILTITTIGLLTLIVRAFGISVQGSIELSDLLMIIASAAAAIAATFSYFLARSTQRSSMLRDSCFLLVRRDFDQETLKYEFSIINQGPGICFLTGVQLKQGDDIISIEDDDYLDFFGDLGFSSSLEFSATAMSLPIALRPGTELTLVAARPNWKNMEFVKKNRANAVNDALNSIKFHIDYEDIHRTKRSWPVK